MTWINLHEYPFQPHYWETKTNRLHYIDEGAGPTLLFVHGTPSWSFDFRNVIKILRRDFRCIAPDHIGFGLSDKPADYDYSTANHARTLEQFILSHDLSEITLVMHDFGGPIGFQVALDHPERIKNIVVINSWLWDCSDDPAWRRMKPILASRVLPFLYLYLNFSARFLLPSSFGDRKLSKGLHRHYVLPFDKPSRRHGPLAFARSLLRDHPWFESMWQRKSVLQPKPVLLIWGMKDRFIGENHLDRFADGFPRARIARIETAGHFPQEEEPGQVAEALLDFLSANR